MADLCDLMDEWVERGAEKKIERTYEDLYFPLYDENGVDMKDGIHVREGCERCKKALTNAIKKCVFLKKNQYFCFCCYSFSFR